MEKMTFSGITRLDPGEALASDNYSFQSDDRRIIDRLLEIGARTHRHNAALALENPTELPGVASGTVGGAIPAALPIYVGYTVVDADNGESALSPSEMVTTSDGILRPESAFIAEIDYSAGSLLTDTYYYVLTWTDGVGGETGMGPTVSVDRDPGFPNAQVNLSGLIEGMDDAGAVGWRLYRATGGAEFGLIATGTIADDTFTDTGAVAADCTQLPPRDEDNTTGSTNTLAVTLPATAPEGAVGLRLYVSLDGSFTEGGLIGTFVVPDDLGTVQQFTALEVVPARPPIVSTSIGGANKVDPDTELLENTWKRPVEHTIDLPATGNTIGDTRLVRQPSFGPIPAPYVWDGDSWEPAGGGGGGHAIEDEGVAVNPRSNLSFEGAGVALTDDAANDRTVVTIPGGGGGGGRMPLGTALEWEDADGNVVFSIEAHERSFPNTTTLYESDYPTDADYAATGWGSAAMDKVGDFVVPVGADAGVNSYQAASTVSGDFQIVMAFQILDAAGFERLGVIVGGGIGTDGLFCGLSNMGGGANDWWFYIGVRNSNGRGDSGATDFVAIPAADILEATHHQISLTRRNGVFTAVLGIDDPGGWVEHTLEADLSANPTYGTGDGLGYGMHADWTTVDAWNSGGYSAYLQDFVNELVIASTPTIGQAHHYVLDETGRFRDTDALRSGADFDPLQMDAPNGGIIYSFDGSRVFLDGQITPLDTAETLIAYGFPQSYQATETFNVIDAAGNVQILTLAWDAVAERVELTRSTTGTDAFSLNGLSYFTG